MGHATRSYNYQAVAQLCSAIIVFLLSYLMGLWGLLASLFINKLLLFLSPVFINKTYDGERYGVPTRNFFFKLFIISITSWTIILFTKFKFNNKFSTNKQEMILASFVWIVFSFIVYVLLQYTFNRKQVSDFTRILPFFKGVKKL